MNTTLMALDAEWSDLVTDTSSARALASWTQAELALEGFEDLGAILHARRDPAASPAILAALARLAPTDMLASRTLLQALLPGLIRMAATACSDDPAALDELISLAWERIRTYPASRTGSVAANVLWDVRKRYRAHRKIDAPVRTGAGVATEAEAPSAEDVVLGRSAIDGVLAAERTGVINATELWLILRTRIGDASLAEVAAEHETSTAHANCVRWRAERRLRPMFMLAS